MGVQKWCKETVIDAFKLHASLHGDPPTSKEWTSRYRPDYAPTTATVRVVFGSWNAAMEAAGFDPRPRGAPGHLVPAERDELGHFL